MEAYFRVFINFEHNDWAQLLSVAGFIYNNAKNANSGYISFKLNYRYYFCIFYEQDFDPHLKSKTIERFSSELQKLITIY